MILIAGTVDFDPERREAALLAARELLAPTRQQPGCLDYVWSADPATPGRVYVYERWADGRALAAHFAGPWYPKMLAALAPHGIRRIDVSKYRVALAEPVYDAGGRPRADFADEGGPG